MNNWYELPIVQVISELNADPSQGLKNEQISQIQAEKGRNEFAKPKPESLLQSIFRQLKEISTIILLCAAGLSFALALRENSGFLEPAVIMSIVIMNLILALTQERSAERALEALSKLNSPFCIVLRDGVQQKIDTVEVVPGDIIILKTGDMIPADARLIINNNFYVDESSLTGESETVEKDAEAVLEGSIPLGDQFNMVFSGCLVTAGNATAVVVATGMQTQMGKIAGYLNSSQRLRTPLQLRLVKVAKVISTIAIIAAVLLLTLGILQGEDFWTMMLLAVTLAVAAVPETLPIIVTLSLSHGVKNMVAKNALVRKLPAVETLGNTSVICSDKTGTLTQNKMSIRKLWVLGEEPVLAEADLSAAQASFLRMLAMASTAKVETNGEGQVNIIGDPTETAIMRLFSDKGFHKSDIEEQYPKVGEIPFSSERKMMTVVVAGQDGGFIVLTKGALDRLPLDEMSENVQQEINEIHDQFAGGALRIIALASKKVSSLPDDLEELENGLDFIGFVGLIDPPRPEAIAAVSTAKKAGIRTIMITGDHAATASAIAKDIGIISDNDQIMTGVELAKMPDEELCENIKNYSVYARVSPEDKIRIVEAWQENNEVVAMTGDGVNDAPALSAADVGVAMGQSGTEVAKSAADIVLTDDNFATIIEAVHEGRNVYSNIRKTIYFLLVCNISEIIIMLWAQIMGWGMPVTPVMLLLVNVIGDGVPGLHLSRELSDPRIMDRGPIHRKESFLSGGLLRVIIHQTIACSAVVLIGYYISAFSIVSDNILPSNLVGQTVAFLILGWTSILHIFTARSRKSIFKRTMRDNPNLVISAIGMVLLFTFMALIPPVGRIFGLTAISLNHWLIAIGLTLLPTVVAEIVKLYDNRSDIRESKAYKDRVVKHQSQNKYDDFD